MDKEDIIFYTFILTALTISVALMNICCIGMIVSSLYNVITEGWTVWEFIGMSSLCTIPITALVIGMDYQTFILFYTMIIEKIENWKMEKRRKDYKNGK